MLVRLQKLVQWLSSKGFKQQSTTPEQKQTKHGPAAPFEHHVKPDKKIHAVTCPRNPVPDSDFGPPSPLSPGGGRYFPRLEKPTASKCEHSVDFSKISDQVAAKYSASAAQGVQNDILQQKGTCSAGPRVVNENWTTTVAITLPGGIRWDGAKLKIKRETTRTTEY